MFKTFRGLTKFVVNLPTSYKLSTLIILPLFLLSINLKFYSFLKPMIGILDAYLIDQLFFLSLFFFLILITWFKLKAKINLHPFIIFLFLSLTIFMLIAQSEILQRYFIKDDLIVMLPKLNNTELLHNAYTNYQDFYYYHFIAFSLLFKLFHYNSYYYNIFALTTMALGATIFLSLLRQVNLKNGLKQIALPLLITLFFLVSPAIMDNYMYLEHSVATGYIIASVILSAYFYIFFLKQRSQVIYFILSYVLVLFLLKTTMARAGFWPLSLIALEIIFFPKSAKEKLFSLYRSTLLLIPFYLMAKTYLTPNVHSRLFEVDFTRFIDIDRLYLLFANLIPLIIPYQFLAGFYSQLRIILLSDVNAVTSNFILNNMFFTAGTIFFFVINSLIFILWRKKAEVRYILFFWFCSIASLSFYIILGNAFDKGINVFDFSVIHYPSTPGSRYYPLPLLFLLATFYLLIAKFFEKPRKKILYYTFCGILILAIWSNINFTQNVNRDANTGIKAFKNVTEEMLKIIGNEPGEKVIYSTNGLIRSVTFVGRGFAGFFGPPNPTYLDDKEELLKFLKSNKILKENLYAFYFDEVTMQFVDDSSKIRSEMSSYLISQ